MYALPAELTDKVEAAVLIALPEAPISPALEVRLTVATSQSTRSFSNSTSSIKCNSASTSNIDITSNSDIAGAVVTKLNVSPLPAELASRLTEPALDTYALVPALTDKLDAAVRIALPPPDAPILTSSRS